MKLKTIIKEKSDHIKSLKNFFPNLLFPEGIYCISCGNPLEKNASVYSLCDECLNSLHWANEKTCRICGKPLEDWYPSSLCSECTAGKHVFDAGMTCFQYREAERELLHHFKYNGESYIARHLADMFVDKMRAEGVHADLIVPVPMFIRKEKKRGYNQATLIARFISGRTGIPYSDRLLLRVRDTVPMNRLSGRERRHNLDDAFALAEKGAELLRDAHVILIDDIYTTGVTADRCSEVLKKNGCRKVTVMTAAAGRNQRELPDLRKLVGKKSLKRSGREKSAGKNAG